MQYTFESYELEFAKVYDDGFVRAQRKTAFEANLAKIKVHNRYSTVREGLHHVSLTVLLH